MDKSGDQREQRGTRSIIQYFQNVLAAKVAKSEKSKQFKVETSSNVRHSGEKLNENIKNGWEETSFVQKEQQFQEKVNIWDKFYDKKNSNIDRGA